MFGRSPRKVSLRRNRRTMHRRRNARPKSSKIDFRALMKIAQNKTSACWNVQREGDAQIRKAIADVRFLIAQDLVGSKSSNKELGAGTEEGGRRGGGNFAVQASFTMSMSSNRAGQWALVAVL